MRKSMDKLLRTLFQSIDIDVCDKQINQFTKYYEYLIEKNKVMNLTSITEKEDVAIKHFIDSIAVLKHIDFDDCTIIDVGTGGGFPGIPLAIMCPKSKFVLMDSLNKRINFLNEVIDLINLNNVECIHSRAEDLGQNEEYREKFDYCVSRAVADMSLLLEYCIPFVKVGGNFISYKSGNVDQEISFSKNAQNKLCCKNKESFYFNLPGTDYGRSFICFEKFDSTSKKFPRSAGKPKKKPL